MEVLSLQGFGKMEWEREGKSARLDVCVCMERERWEEAETETETEREGRFDLGEEGWGVQVKDSFLFLPSLILPFTSRVRSLFIRRGIKNHGPQHQ